MHSERAMLKCCVLSYSSIHLTAGCLQPGSSVERFWDVWRLYDIDLQKLSFAHIHFRAMVPQLPKLLALFFTVAFGSSMDVVRPSCLVTASLTKGWLSGRGVIADPRMRFA